MAKTPKPPAAKDADLPTMEDRVIKDLHKAAVDYDEVKKRRMALTLEEVEAKGKVRDLMHKHKRTHYAFGGIEITLEPPDGEEKVKVKVTTGDESASDGDEE